MKTTIDLPEDLMMEAKRTALNRRITLRALMMSGLRRELMAEKPSSHALLDIAAVGGTDWLNLDADGYLEKERNSWQ